MKKFLKIGITILVAVLVLIVGTGMVLAKKDIPDFTSPSASYDAGYSWCPQQCQGAQGCTCFQQGNCAADCTGYYRGCGNGANCYQAGYCEGYCAGAGVNAGYQPRCGGCLR